MKKLIVSVFVIISAIYFSSCGFVIPDYIARDEIELEKERQIAKTEKRILDSAGIIVTQSTTNKYITDNFGRKLVLIANPNQKIEQKVTITDQDSVLLYSGTLDPGEIKREYFLQTKDQKIYCVWEMKGKKPYSITKPFPEGPAVQEYKKERCHAFTFGWP